MNRLKKTLGLLCAVAALALTACGATCTVEGVDYADGDAVPSSDCNACTCTEDGVVCTTMACDG